MIVKIVYDNKALQNFKASWGFSCFIEHNINLLFDTGGRYGILKNNMEKLGINLNSIDAIFISHSHWDHAGGLKKLKFDGKIYVPPSSNLKGIKVDEEEFLSNFISTGEINGEQSLIVKNDDKLIIFTGCSHNGLRNVIKIAEKYGRIHAIIGGFHDFNEIELLKKYEMIMPCHCTKLKRKIETFPNAIECLAGKVVKI
ncbi:MAG TPA: MBL fold metallo-hydrolase [Thermoplasmatales archaeon]|nr:MBL fold metallo-hydrolase [Thermoplasmatales archaeon]